MCYEVSAPTVRTTLCQSALRRVSFLPHFLRVTSALRAALQDATPTLKATFIMP